MLKRHTILSLLILFNLMHTTNCLAVSVNEYSPDNKPQTYKTSFNCDKARTNIEHAICHSKKLADADRVLSKLYYQLEDKQPSAFVNRQKMWLKERDYCISSLNLEHCLLNKYQDRILLLKNLKLSVSSKDIQADEPKEVSHPVLPVLQKHNISLEKVVYSQDSKCPTFHVKFKIYPLSTQLDEYSKKAYSEILEANSSFPYALVDEESDFKVNVGFSDKAKTHITIRPAEVSSPTTCLDGSVSPDAEHYTVIAQMKKQILNSPFKARLHQNDGGEIIAYLYAIDEKTISYDYYGCTNGIKLRAKAKTGHYYIYLYDEVTDYFYPTRIPVFKGDKPTIMGIEGASFVTFPANGDVKTDTLVVSQRDNCDESFYETFHLWEDQTSLQKRNSFHHYSHLGFYLRENKNRMQHFL
ncbi:lysozyme inhibitor LprI family protein [Legionella quateirensis]|uniref:Uncharacterized protein conserved in bacteria, putative lipoprotein n=1 Tax=Legionella quateirensis TaxID=45072 RepID=A0A378KQP6_9GAMM|nr:lysozyme inhibitor LprI family protein [Legionella quateirensis]KTD52994.1 hypothetical protein Lqua_0827 [Legionella quateirensis]STY17214.1 Uncharacterized protein conserved in bacteria, putative lipoprotein [Legionella quateirensis]